MFGIQSLLSDVLLPGLPISLLKVLVVPSSPSKVWTSAANLWSSKHLSLAPSRSVVLSTDSSPVVMVYMFTQELLWVINAKVLAPSSTLLRSTKVSDL